MVATGLAYDAGVRAAQAEVLERLIPQVRDIRRFGSAALDLCWTAAGRYDAYFERTVKPWDIAAGELICERAGLELLELPEAGRAAVGDPRRAPGAGRAVARDRRRGLVAAASGQHELYKSPIAVDAADRCGGWDSNPHALSDRAF